MKVTAPADKRFRRSHAKPGRKRARWAVRGRAIVGVIAVVAAAAAAHRAIAIVSNLEMFEVHKITVDGNHRLSTGEVLTLLDGLKGRSALSLDLEEWRTAVLTSPWVAEASLRRSLPATVAVTIREREPLGIGRISGVLFLVDDRGAVIDEYGPNYADLDLPIIDGLSVVPGETGDAVRAMLARRLLDAVRTRKLAVRISQIDVSDSRNAVVLLDGDPTMIRLGDERFLERLESYLDLAPALRDRVPEIDYVDLRFGERVYVRPAQPATTPGRKSTVKRGRTQTG
jgi:cell division protein FtsQ